ncbi:MAG: MotA/TolQ/ExbB proton channel family protein [Lentisphaeria bacterium]|nr:MotA/TolQ/ExbB proton channel family protein [Lentisphaeria bacterium]
MIPVPGLAASSFTYAFTNSDLLGKLIVVVLFGFSVVTWCIMIIKGIGLKSACNDSEAFLNKFRAKRNPLSMADRIEEEPSPAARVCEAAYRRIDQMNILQPDGTRRALKFTEIDIVRATLEQAVADQILVLESTMLFLATAVSTSPFLGLFGTVWGIMLAFTELAMAGKADIQTLAPGVSGALLTTVAGLLVAIPSVIGYNMLTSRIKSTIVHLDNFVEEFIVKLKIENLNEEERNGSSGEQ